MKNKKLNLNELKVKSFVTDLEKGQVNTINGGDNFHRASVIFGCIEVPTAHEESCDQP